MNELELYKDVHNQVLGYADTEMLRLCTDWGYTVQQKLSQCGRFIVEGKVEDGSDFMYAVVTACIVGEFARYARNDYFNDEVEIDLDLLGIDFDQVRGFLEKDITADRLRLLERNKVVGLQDMWTAINEWKQDTYNSLAYIYKQEGVDPNKAIFDSLVKTFETTDDGGVVFSNLTATQELSAYEYVSSGFQC